MVTWRLSLLVKPCVPWIFPFFIYIGYIDRWASATHCRCNASRWSSDLLLYSYLDSDLIPLFSLHGLVAHGDIHSRAPFTVYRSSRIIYNLLISLIRHASYWPIAIYIIPPLFLLPYHNFVCTD